MQEVMKEIRQGIVGRALEETGPRVQQCLGDLTIMSSFAEPLRELMFGESVEDVRLLNIFEMQTVWDTILGKYFLDLLRGEGIEPGVILVHGTWVFVLAPSSGGGEELQEAFHKSAACPQVFDVLICCRIAATEMTRKSRRSLGFQGKRIRFVI